MVEKIMCFGKIVEFKIVEFKIVELFFRAGIKNKNFGIFFYGGITFFCCCARMKQ